jgi:hypothetical protein
MKAGIIGVDCFLSIGIPLRVFLAPLISVFAISSVRPLTACAPFVRGGISREGEAEGLVSEGVSICREVVLELERECVFVFKGFPPKDLLVWLLVIACSSGSNASFKTSDKEPQDQMTTNMLARC